MTVPTGRDQTTQPLAKIGWRAFLSYPLLQIIWLLLHINVLYITIQHHSRQCNKLLCELSKIHTRFRIGFFEWNRKDRHFLLGGDTSAAPVTQTGLLCCASSTLSTVDRPVEPEYDAPFSLAAQLTLLPSGGTNTENRALPSDARDDWDNNSWRT